MGTSHFLLPTSYFPLPTSHFPFLTSYFPLPTSHFSLPTSHFLLLPSSFHVCTWSIGCGLSIWLLLRLLLWSIIISVSFELLNISRNTASLVVGGHLFVYINVRYMVTRAYAVLPSYLPAATGGKLSRDEIIQAYFPSVYAYRDILVVLFRQEGIRLSYMHLKRLLKKMCLRSKRPKRPESDIQIILTAMLDELAACSQCFGHTRIWRRLIHFINYICTCEAKESSRTYVDIGL